MKKSLISALLLAVLAVGCAVVPAGRHGELTIVPLLPPLVVLGPEPYYFHGGFYYHFNRDAWFYSRSRGGPWLDLPRDRYPKEVRFEGREGWGRGRGHDGHR